MDDSLFPDSMTLGEARPLLRKLVYEPYGHTCPLCSQHAQVYRWSLYSTAAHALILLLKLGAATKPVHTRQLKEKGHRGQGDISRLRLWGLVEEERVRREDGGRAGFWHITPTGERFARLQASIPKYVHVYDTRALSYSGEPVSIEDCLGTKFNYRDLMEGGE